MVSSLATAGLFMPCCAAEGEADHGDDLACHCICPSLAFVVQTAEDALPLIHSYDRPVPASLGLPLGEIELPVRPPIVTC